MKLLNHTLQALFSNSKIDENIHHKWNEENQKVICKFYLPFSGKVWYVFSGERYFDNDYRFFGAIHSGSERKSGYFRLSELKKVKGQYNDRVVRDESVFNQLYRNLY
jgi:hypothetical protein